MNRVYAGICALLMALALWACANDPGSNEGGAGGTSASGGAGGGLSCAQVNCPDGFDCHEADDGKLACLPLDCSTVDCPDGYHCMVEGDKRVCEPDSSNSSSSSSSGSPSASSSSGGSDDSCGGKLNCPPGYHCEFLGGNNFGCILNGSSGSSSSSSSSSSGAGGGAPGLRAVKYRYLVANNAPTKSINIYDEADNAQGSPLPRPAPFGPTLEDQFYAWGNAKDGPNGPCYNTGSGFIECVVHRPIGAKVRTNVQVFLNDPPQNTAYWAVDTQAGHLNGTYFQIFVDGVQIQPAAEAWQYNANVAYGRFAFQL